MIHFATVGTHNTGDISLSLDCARKSKRAGVHLLHLQPCAARSAYFLYLSTKSQMLLIIADYLVFVQVLSFGCNVQAFVTSG